MMRHRGNILALALAMALLGTGVGWAQQGDTGAESEATPSMESDSDNLEAELSGLDGEDMLEASQGKVSEMRTKLDQTNELREKVRREEKDILKLNCINEKLAAIKGFVKVSEESYVNLKNAVSRDDREAEKHHYTLIAIADQKVGGLAQAAQVCAGEVLRFAEETVRETNVDPDIAEIDPIEIDDDEYDDGYVRDRLPELTPYQ